MQTINKTDENFKKLASMFPNAVTETIDENGELVRAIDKDVLMQEISCKVVDGNEERYQFTWPDKKKSVILANAPINKTLRPIINNETSPSGEDSQGNPYCSSGSVCFDTTENLYIEGDNLEVLKLLQEAYLDKINLIYIDPPYNTGKDFVYNDDYSQNVNEYLANSGQYNSNGNRLVTNTESNGRFHTDWLNMIFPRLRIAKDLLADDGIIIVSIGDKELRNLMAVMDEIYGSNNQVGCFVWKSRAKPTNAGNSRFRPQKVAEYVLVYSKGNPETQMYNVIPAKERTYPHEDKHGKFRTTTILTSNRGTFRRETMRFESHGYTPNEDFRWKAGKEIIDQLYDTDHMYINEDGTPMEKKYVYEETDPLYPIYTFIDSDLSGTAENGKSELGNLVGKQHGFDTVKPVQLIKYLLQTFAGKDDIILDFFSGSATTAQAVMEQNAEDGGRRKYILVQVAEVCNHNGEAYRAGFQNICDIGKKRIIKAGDKIKKASPLTTTDLDIGFRVLKCDSSNMKDVYYTPDNYHPSLFEELEDNIKEDRTPEDLLFQVMIDLGVLLSSRIKETRIAGKKIFDVENGYLMACFDRDVTDEVIIEVAKKKPYYFVMRDNSMANDSVATNFEQIFKAYSPNTIRKVL